MIKIENLKVRYGDLELFDGLSAVIQSGEKVAVVGESGSGKSTLIHTLLGFLPDFKGEIFYDNMPLDAKHVRQIRKQTSWVPQDLSFTVFPTVRELFFAPFGFKANRKKFPSREKIRQIFRAFQLTEDLLDRHIKEISGGQKQRLLLAAAVLLEKPYLYLDEPTSALNEEIKKEVTDYILGLEGVTVIAATHDPYFIRKVDKVITLKSLTHA